MRVCTASVFSLQAATAAAAAANVTNPRWRTRGEIKPNSSLALAQTGDLSDVRLPFLYGTAWKKEATTQLVVQAVRQGFRGVDTACQPRHYREDLVGAALVQLEKEDGIHRDELWLQTKFTPLRGQDPNRVPYDPAAPLHQQVEQSIATSLRNLGTDHIDCLVLHSPMQTLNDTLVVWNVFEQAVDRGIVRQLGISNCYDPQMFHSIYESARVKPMVLQNRFYADAGYDTSLRSYCLERGIAYQSFWTLTANPHILRSTPVGNAAARLRATPAQVLFCWLIQSGHQPLTGTTSLHHMRQDLAAPKLMLSDAEMIEIGSLFR